MATTEPKDIWAELRKPFDPKAVGKIPKGGVQLDYVGHAAVTDRLLTVDPNWTWEPVAYDERGLPQYDNAGGLWIRLTIGGVTRLGYGDGPDPKQRIGDALRNAAMRFGVALDLWSKDELESNIENPENKNVKPSAAPAPVSATTTPVKTDNPANRPANPDLITQQQFGELVDIAKKKGCKTAEDAMRFLRTATGLDDPTIMPAAYFDSYKKQVMGDFSKPTKADTAIDLSDIPF